MRKEGQKGMLTDQERTLNPTYNIFEKILKEDDQNDDNGTSTLVLVALRLRPSRYFARISVVDLGQLASLYCLDQICACCASTIKQS